MFKIILIIVGIIAFFIVGFVYCACVAAGEAEKKMGYKYDPKMVEDNKEYN